MGVVVVGDPPRPDRRPRIDVPGDFATIQAAVDAAAPGSTIVVAPGRTSIPSILIPPT